jgi:hypothetical protein
LKVTKQHKYSIPPACIQGKSEPERSSQLTTTAKATAMKAGMESFILGAGLATIGRYEYLRCIVGEVEDDRRAAMRKRGRMKKGGRMRKRKKEEEGEKEKEKKREVRGFVSTRQLQAIC